MLLLFDVSYLFFVLQNSTRKLSNKFDITIPTKTPQNNQTNKQITKIIYATKTKKKKKEKLYFRHVRVNSFDHPAELTLKQFYDNTMTNLKSNSLKLWVKPLKQLAHEQMRQNTSIRATKKNKIWFVNCCKNNCI